MSYQVRFSHNVDSSSSSRVEYMLVEMCDEYLEATAHLINTEWPRSLDQRVQSLRYLVKEEKVVGVSVKQLPVSLIIIDLATTKVVGHASIVSIATVDPTAAEDTTTTTESTGIVNLPFLQSIIIDKSVRGRGMGKRLMLLCEKYFVEYINQVKSSSSLSCSIDRFDHLYLNTKDQQRFYETLGYTQIEPMLFFTNKNNSRCGQMAKMLFKSMSSSSSSSQRGESIQSVVSNNSHSKSGFFLPPPPPPPPPPFLPSSQSSSSSSLTWYKKRINSTSLCQQLESLSIPLISQD